MSKYNLRKMFLEEFTKQLIRSTVPASENEESVSVTSESSELVVETPALEPEPQREVMAIMPPQKTKLVAEPRSDIVEWGKLLPLVQDPSVTMIECPGFDKNIVVKQNGTNAATSFALTRDEIHDLIEQVSSKTGVSIREGILQTETALVSMTAILSDYVGDRFILQKKS